MSWFEAIFLGFIQGVTEFLPISSSGHLAIFQNIFGMQDLHADENRFYDVLLHLGTLVAVFVVYRKDLREMTRAMLFLFSGGRRGGGEEPIDPGRARLAFMIIVATLTLVIVLPFHSIIQSLGTRTWFVGLMLLITGTFLYFSGRLTPGRKDEKKMTVKDSLTVGLLQCVGTIPGISRSGITITGGIFTGLERGFSVRFSFLLSVPAIIGANIVTLFTSLSDVDWALMPRYLVGVIVAGVTGFFAIKLVKLLVETQWFGKFSYYCWFIGIVAIIASLFT